MPFKIILIYSSGLLGGAKSFRHDLLESIVRNISAKLFCICTSDITLVSKYSFQIEETLTLQVSLAEIYLYIMILNLNMIYDILDPLY